MLALFEDWTTEAMLKCYKGDNPTALMVQAGLCLPLVIQVVHSAVQATGNERGERAWRVVLHYSAFTFVSAAVHTLYGHLDFSRKRGKMQ